MAFPGRAGPRASWRAWLPAIAKVIGRPPERPRSGIARFSGTKASVGVGRRAGPYSESGDTAHAARSNGGCCVGVRTRLLPASLAPRPRATSGTKAVHGDLCFLQGGRRRALSPPALLRPIPPRRPGHRKCSGLGLGVKGSGMQAVSTKQQTSMPRHYFTSGIRPRRRWAAAGAPRKG